MSGTSCLNLKLEVNDPLVNAFIKLMNQLNVILLLYLYIVHIIYRFESEMFILTAQGLSTLKHSF